MRQEVIDILTKYGTVNVSGDTSIYVTVSPEQVVKVTDVRYNDNKQDIEFKARGIDVWLSENNCIHNTAPRIQLAVLDAHR